MMNDEPKRPYFDRAVFEAKRAERAEDAARFAQLLREVKRAFGFGTCQIVSVENQKQTSKKT